MKTRWLNLPRGSGPTLRVQVLSVNGPRRRRVVQKLLTQGMPHHHIRLVLGLSTPRFHILLSKLTVTESWSKVLKQPAHSDVFWSGDQLSLFAEVRHDQPL